MFKLFGGVEEMATVFVLCGVAFVGLVLWTFSVHERYRSPAAALSPVEREWAMREVGEAFAELAPRVLLLGRLEEAVGLALREGVTDGTRSNVEGRLRRVDLGALWRDLACASTLGAEDPVRALSELRRVEARLDECLEELEKIGQMLHVGQGVGVPSEGEKDV